MSTSLRAAIRPPQKPSEAAPDRAMKRFDSIAVPALLAALMLVAPELCGAETTPKPSRQPHVLVLYSNERLLPANVAVDEAIHETIASELETPAEFYTEFLDADRFPGEEHQRRTRDFLEAKYRERPPDIIIAGGSAALSFLIRYRETLFSGVPVVHCGITPNGLPDALPDDLMVGTPHSVNMADTLKLALRLQPDTRRMLIVSGPQSNRIEPDDAAKLAPQIEFRWITNVSMPELSATLSGLPDHTVVLYGTLFRDPAGNAFTPRDALSRFAPTSRAPIYGHYDTYLGHGIVGGSMVTYRTIGQVAAHTAIRILDGDPPQEAVRGTALVPTPMFDGRQLRRWKIDESRSPSGAVILFRDPTLWENHKWTILAGITLCLLEAALIFVLIRQLRQRRLAESLARASERTAQELSGRLIRTQEEERSRIARDLHDDFNQRLALLSVEIDLLRQKIGTTDPAAKLKQLGDHVRELSTDLHQLAYQLHPAKLDQLGLVVAVNGLCREITEKSGLDVEFVHTNIPRELPADLARCLFRVTQESLHNVVRHGATDRARVELSMHAHSVMRLLVSDPGKGFDVKEAWAAGGLGLLSMRERVRLLRGDLEIRSRDGEGTRVMLTIPFRNGETAA